MLNPFIKYILLGKFFLKFGSTMTNSEPTILQTGFRVTFYRFLVWAARALSRVISNFRNYITWSTNGFSIFFCFLVLLSWFWSSYVSNTNLLQLWKQLALFWFSISLSLPEIVLNYLVFKMFLYDYPSGFVLRALKQKPNLSRKDVVT